MKKLVPFFVFCLVLLLLSPAFAVMGIYLTYNPQLGDLSRYKMVSTSKNTVEGVGSFTSEQVVTWKQKVTHIEDSLITIKGIITYSKGTINSPLIKEKDAPFDMETLKEGTKFLVKFLKNGEIVESSLGTSGGNIFHQLIFPKRKLKIGDSWTQAMSLGENVQAKCELIDVVWYKGYRCAKISVETTQGRLNFDHFSGLPQSNALTNVSTRGVVYFAYKEGKVIKTIMKKTMDIKTSSEKQETLLTNSSMETIVELQE